MGDRNADSPTRNEDGELLFVKPWEEQQPFNDFVEFVAKQEKEGRDDLEVRYAQTRAFHVIHPLAPSFSNFHSSFCFEKTTDQNTENDNLRNEYSTLFSHVEKDISWARIALRQQPEAINLWIGNSRSVTALHKDNYENIYVQVIGQKHFVLLPPLAYPCIAEKELPPASYIRSSNSNLEIQKEDGDKVPFATWDPDSKEDGNVEKVYERFARPVRVTLEKGDMLYLPAMWYHKVSQSCSEEGICCAANYWSVVCTALRGSLLII
jgi:jumonji domain-containing protein 7